MYDRLKGVLPEPIGEGTHIRIPWLQNPTIMDIRTRPRSISSVTGTQGAEQKYIVAHAPPLLELLAYLAQATWMCAQNRNRRLKHLFCCAVQTCRW